MATVTLSDGGSVTATDHHKFWVASKRAWLELEDLRPGDHLFTPQGLSEVASVYVAWHSETVVWELDIADDDTFAVYTGTTDVRSQPERTDSREFSLRSNDGGWSAAGVQRNGDHQ
jgi:intein/homing endonuclease